MAAVAAIAATMPMIHWSRENGSDSANRNDVTNGMITMGGIAGHVKVNTPTSAIARIAENIAVLASSTVDLMRITYAPPPLPSTCPQGDGPGSPRPRRSSA